MHKQILAMVLFGASSIVFSGCSIVGNTEVEKSVIQSNIQAPASTELGATPIPLPADFTARFEIYTNGTKRIFTDAKYHNQSGDVYIEKLDPQVIFVKKSDTTWNDFFSSLPFSLDTDCLVTGTNQTFCNSETKRLHFYLNGPEIPDVLDRAIVPNDFLRIEYGAI